MAEADNNNDDDNDNGRFALFAKLPPELRLMIWRHAVGVDELRLHVGTSWAVMADVEENKIAFPSFFCDRHACCRDQRRRSGNPPAAAGRDAYQLAHAVEGLFWAADEQGPEYRGDASWCRLSLTCREARQAVVERFPQTMLVFRRPTGVGAAAAAAAAEAAVAVDYSGPCRRIRYDGDRDVLAVVAWRSTRLPPEAFGRPPPPPPGPHLNNWRAALTSFRRLAFVGTEKFIFSSADVHGAVALLCLADAARDVYLCAAEDPPGRVPDDAVRVDDVDSLAADTIRVAHVKKVARQLRRRAAAPGIVAQWYTGEPLCWVTKPRPPLRIGCYVVP